MSIVAFNNHLRVMMMAPAVVMTMVMFNQHLIRGSLGCTCRDRERDAKSGESAERD
jgi:hypothetical protein